MARHPSRKKKTRKTREHFGPKPGKCNKPASETLDTIFVRTAHRPRITYVVPRYRPEGSTQPERSAAAPQCFSPRTRIQARSGVDAVLVQDEPFFGGEPGETRGVCLFTRYHAPSSSRRRRHHRGAASTRVSCEGPRTQTHAPPHTLKTAPQWLKRPRDEVRQCEDRPAVTVCALPQPFASAGVSVQGEDARDAAPSRITAA